MELIKLQVSQWGIDFRTYFGDIYIPTRTILLVGGIVVVLRIAKLIRKAWR